jgi:hypothetical protein
MVPLKKNEVVEDHYLLRLFLTIWTVSLFHWLSGKGMKEVIERAFEARLELAPLLLTTAFLALIVIRDWDYLNNLNPQEIDTYYNKTKA